MTTATIRTATAEATVAVQRRLNITPADVAAAQYAVDHLSTHGAPRSAEFCESDLRLAFLAGAHYAFSACQKLSAGMLRRESDATVARS